MLGGVGREPSGLSLGGDPPAGGVGREPSGLSLGGDPPAGGVGREPSGLSLGRVPLFAPSGGGGSGPRFLPPPGCPATKTIAVQTN